MLGDLWQRLEQDTEYSAVFDPSAIENGCAAAVKELRLPYSISYWINIDGISYGAYGYDPEVDIEAN